MYVIFYTAINYYLTIIYFLLFFFYIIYIVTVSRKLEILLRPIQACMQRDSMTTVQGKSTHNIIILIAYR